MEINEKIINAIMPIVPVCVPHMYNGTETEYCTFNYTRFPDEFFDNRPQSIVYSIQIHYYVPLGVNPEIPLEQISKALFSASFDFPQIVDATDEVCQHYVFETGCTEVVSWESR